MDWKWLVRFALLGSGDLEQYAILPSGECFGGGGS